MTHASEDQSPRRFFVSLPDGFNEMSEEEQEQALLEMAREAQRQLGIEPNA